MSGNLSSIVAQHYNELQEKGLEERSRSRIFHLRNFNNWIKSMLIGEFIRKIRNDEGSSKKKTVLDIGAGKGGDLLKWKKGQIDYLICAVQFRVLKFGRWVDALMEVEALLNKIFQVFKKCKDKKVILPQTLNFLTTDIAETSVEQCHQRYIDMLERHKRQRERGHCFDAEFITADCTKERLKDKYKDPNIQFDLVSCQFTFHYCFESLPQAKRMIQNASESLRPGGYFIGTTPDSYDIMRRLEDSADCSFGNDVFSVSFKSKENLSLFGAQYDFHLEGVVDCPEFMVYFPAFEKLAADCGLKLLFCKRFDDFFNEYSNTEDGKFLLTRMQALETYPPFKDQKVEGSDTDDYIDAKKKVKELEEEEQHGSEKPSVCVGTLSKPEWEAVCMYVVFAFIKEQPKEEDNEEC